MEVDSLIPDNKTSENKLSSPFNYAYKTIIIKEKQENSNYELDSLNYENIAKYKIKRMNLRILLDSIIKVKNSLNKNNPFLRYIKDAKPYIYFNKRIIKAKTEPILDKYKLRNNNLKKEKCLNFANTNRNYKNFYYSRMYNIDCKKINCNKIEKILLIQKHIRGYLTKKIVNEEVNKIIAKRIINKILTIQRAIKRLLNRKNSLDKIIAKIIKDERNSKGNKITDIFSLYHYKNLYKKNLIKNKLLKARNDSILLIQRKFRNLLFVKNVKEILKKEKKSYVLTYPFKAESVKMKLYINNSYKLYKYFLCPIRKYFILYIDKGEINPGEYVCQMIVNNNITLDRRYKYIIDKRNDLFNLIFIGQPPLIKKPKEPLKDNLKKIQNKEDKKNEENSEEFYFYCYNDASNSTNSYSSKSEHEKNKFLLKTEKIKHKENSIFNKEENQKINDFLKSYKKPEKENIPTFPPKSRFCNFVNINKGNINKKNISMKRGDFDTNFKDIIDENETREHKSSLDIQSSKKDGSIYSQQVNYNNILDELNQSISSIKSNSSIKNINSYSIKIHQTKFSSNQNKIFNKKSLNTSDNSNNITINSTFSYRKYNN